ncbi:hypothetical protein GC176_28325, partial [bacterium]|nr:hypothetical protein [bacterium]
MGVSGCHKCHRADNEHSKPSPGRRNAAQAANHAATASSIPAALLRTDRPLLPEASEMDVV